MKRTLLLLLWCVALPASLGAQTRGDAAQLLAQGDAAFARRDTAAARIAYEGVLQVEPNQSRAIYQLGRLQPAGSAASIRLFHRYTELEPGDAWGFLALGEAYEHGGEVSEARAAYTQALALEPRAAEMRAALARVSGARASSRTSGGTLTLEPLARVSGDSDGNRTVRTGFSSGFAVADSVTFGAGVARVDVSDDFTRVRGWEGTLFGEWRPRRTLLVQARGGAVSVSGADIADDVLEAVVHARVRWRRERGPALDMRVRREPIAATPQLFRTPVVLSEARATLDLPVISLLHVRGMTRVGRLRDPFDTNERMTWSAGPVLRLGSGAELNGAYARTTYARPSSAGYFAPRRVESLDAGLYAEHYGWWPITLAVDVGGGVERVTPHTLVLPERHVAGVAGSWERAMHLWLQGSWAFARGGELRLELEAYDTQVGEVVAATPAGWRWGSVGLSASWRL